MLGSNKLFATIAVKDLEEGKKFYTEVLGLNLVSENPGGVNLDSGGVKLFIYQSETAGTNQATCVSWDVASIEDEVNTLKEKGVLFERYDLPFAKWEGDIAVMDPMKAAWFKDPSGNILNISTNN
jgi:catechol 2,3-dioxygenase-like lactoylglutathione lyase family enzyme